MEKRAEIGDFLGVALSGACLVHCSLLPILLPALPFLAIMEAEGVHLALAIFLSFLGIYAFIRGFRIHKNKAVVSAGVIGLTAIIAALVMPEAISETAIFSLISVEAFVTSIGSALLIWGHLHNIKACRCTSASQNCSCLG